MYNHQCVPTYKVTQITTDTTQATLLIDGTLCDSLGNFVLCLSPCADQVCSGLQVIIQDLAGNFFTVFNRKANYAKLGEVEVQACQCGRLYMTRSLDLPHNILWQNMPKCVPTPIVSSSSSVMVASSTKSKSK